MRYTDQQLTIDHERVTPSGVYTLIRDIDENVREQKNGLYDLRRETEAHFKFVERDIGTVKGEVLSVKGSVSSVQADVSELKGDVKALDARFEGTDQRIDDLKESQNKWFTVLGFLIVAMPLILTLVEKYIK